MLLRHLSPSSRINNSNLAPPVWRLGVLTWKLHVCESRTVFMSANQFADCRTDFYCFPPGKDTSFPRLNPGPLLHLPGSSPVPITDLYCCPYSRVVMAAGWVGLVVTYRKIQPTLSVSVHDLVRDKRIVNSTIINFCSNSIKRFQLLRLFSL